MANAESECGPNTESVILTSEDLDWLEGKQRERDVQYRRCDVHKRPSEERVSPVAVQGKINPGQSVVSPQADNKGRRPSDDNSAADKASTGFSR